MASSSETPYSFVYSAPDVNTDNPWSAIDLADLKLAINDSWTLSDAASYAGRKTRSGKRPRRWGLHSPGPRMGRLETRSSHRRDLDAARELRKVVCLAQTQLFFEQTYKDEFKSHLRPVRRRHPVRG